MTVMGEAQWGAYTGYQWGTMWNYFRVHLPHGGGVYTYTTSVEMRRILMVEVAQTTIRDQMTMAAMTSQMMVTLRSRSTMSSSGSDLFLGLSTQRELF
jgi:hypothetical protein